MVTKYIIDNKNVVHDVYYYAEKVGDQVILIGKSGNPYGMNEKAKFRILGPNGIEEPTFEEPSI